MLPIFTFPRVDLSKSEALWGWAHLLASCVSTRAPYSNPLPSPYMQVAAKVMGG